MSCNCNSCNCNPCQCDECDADNEPLSSALDNFITTFYGEITKTCVNGAVVWNLPCNLEAGFPGFPRLENEGVACYLLRIFGAATLLHYFPGSNSVFLDEDYLAMSGNGQPAYGTFQEAYDAANALQISSGKPVVLVVGNISAATSGGVSLTSAWNPDVNIFGLGASVSFLGVISSSAPLTSFSVDLSAHAVNISSIDTSLTSASAVNTAGDISLTGTGNVTVGSLVSSNAGTGTGGAISVSGEGNTITTLNSSSASGSGGAITVTQSNFLGTVVSNSGGSGTAGTIIVGAYTQAGSLSAKGVGVGASGGTINIGAWSDIISTPSPNVDASGGLNGGAVTIQKYATCLGITSEGTLGAGGAVDTFDHCNIRGTLITSGGTLSGVIQIRRFNEVNSNIVANGGTGVSNILLRENTTVEGSITSVATTGNCGTLELKFNCRCTTITHTALAGNTGALSLRQNCIAGNITNAASGTVGDILLEEGVVVGNVDASSSAGTGAPVTIMNASSVGSITMGSINPGVLKCDNVRITGPIDNLTGTSVLHACVLSTGSGLGACIVNVTANTPRITNCLFVPDGASDSIDGTVARNVLSYNNLFKNAVDANITLLGANNNVDALLRAP